MNPHVFAEWLRRQGRTVVQTQSSFWVQAGPRFFQAFPYHWQVNPDQDELNFLLRHHDALGARYSAPWDAAEGIASYHVVFTETEYALLSLPKKARHDVEKGLKVARIQPISLERLAHEGWLLRQETLVRQKREGAETQDWWRNLCMSADGLPGFEAWGAIVDGELAAALLAFTCEGWCSILYQQSRTSYLPLAVNNALTFSFTREVLGRSDPPKLFYGLHSLDAPPSVDEFKFRMGYTARPVRQRVVFHPWIAPALNAASYTLLRSLLRWQPKNFLLTKAEGLMRFYLEGKRPLDQQTWPDALAHHADINVMRR